MAGSSILNNVMLAQFGLRSTEYLYAYCAGAGIMPFIQAAVLWDVCRKLPVRVSINRSDIQVCGIMFLIVCGPLYLIAFSFEGADFFPVYQAVVTPLNLVLFVAVVRLIARARRSIDLGRNLRGIMFGMGLLILADCINIERAFAVQSGILYAFLLQFAKFVVFGIWATDLWTFDPPRLRPETGSAPIKQGRRHSSVG